MTRLMVVLPLILVLWVCSTKVSAQQALVRSLENQAMEIGQSYLSHSGDRCFAVLPTHVAAEAGGVAAFLGEGTNPLLGESTRLIDLGDDLSVAELTGQLTSKCGYSTLAVSRAVASRIRANAIASIRSVNGDGSIAQLSVTIVDDDGSTFLRVQPTNDMNQLRKGQSGSLLMTGDSPIGMLLSVNARFGVGKVLRFDAMFEKVDHYISGRSSARPAVSSSVGGTAPSDPSGSKRIVSWSVLPIDAEHRASNLIAADTKTGSWTADTDTWPVELEMELGGRRQAIKGLEFLSDSTTEEGALPQSVEVMISSTASGRRWRSVFGGDLSYSGGKAQIHIAPSWARHVRLIINSVNGGGSRVALHRIRVLEAD